VKHGMSLMIEVGI